MKITEHFDSLEFSCRDGNLYPLDRSTEIGTWLKTRLLSLCETLEIIREAAGGGSIRITSGYRTLEYNRKLGSPDTSQHVKGRAADIQHSTLTVEKLHELVLSLYRAGRLPKLGGIGLYPSFLHLDVRPRLEDGHLSRWYGSRISNVA